MKEYVKIFKNRNFLFLTIISVILVAIVATQVTVALFFGGSNATSTIVISDLNITAEFLNQQGGNLNISTLELIPGNTITRSLKITNAESSEDAYVRIKSIFFIDVNQNAIFEVAEESFAVQMRLAPAQEGWVKAVEGPQHWFYFNGVLQAGQSITVNLEFIVFPFQGNDEYSIGNDEAGKPFNLQTKVNAVQTANNGSSYLTANWPDV